MLKSPMDMHAAIEAAFDYRGDVMLTLTDGSALFGYLFNRDPGAERPFIEFFAADTAEPLRIAYDDIAGIELSGVDPAAGRSWQAWLKKVADAEARGEIAELYPEQLDE